MWTSCTICFVSKVCHWPPPLSCCSRPLPGDRLRSLEEENRRLSDSLHLCLEDVSSVRNSIISQRSQVRASHKFPRRATSHGRLGGDR